MFLRLSNLKWRLLSFLLLSDIVYAQEPPPPTHFQNTLGSDLPSDSSFSSPSSFLATSMNHETVMKEPSSSSAQQLVSELAASLQGHMALRTNLSCAELAAGPWKGAGFSHELLGLVMVPVLASAGCAPEAQDLVLNLYVHLGQADTKELLGAIVTQIRRPNKSSTQTSHSSSAAPKLSKLQAIMFNIQQLADADQNVGGRKCQGWIKVEEATLLGEMSDEGQQMHFIKAKQVCQSLGYDCAGISTEHNIESGLYRVIQRRGSRLVPSSSSKQSESWIQSCGVHLRRRAAPNSNCKLETEEKVFRVVEWIPVVSTLYNLGSAVYYASVKCSDTAIERAVLGAVDLGTDALMTATGGTAGFIIGAGLKTGVKAGVKYVLHNTDEPGNLLFNQNSSEDGTFIFE